MIDYSYPIVNIEEKRNEKNFFVGFRQLNIREGYYVNIHKELIENKKKKKDCHNDIPRTLPTELY